MNIFNLFGKLTLDTSDYEKGINTAKQSNAELASDTQKKSGIVMSKWAAVAAAVIAVANGIKKLVVSTTQYADNIKNMAQIYGYTTKEIQEMQSVAEQSGKSLERVLRGIRSSGQTAAEYLGLSAEEYNKMVQDAYKFNTILSDETLDRVDALGDRITYLKGAFKAVLVSALADDEASEQAVEMWFENLSATIEEYTPMIIRFVLKLVFTIVKSIIKELPTIVTQITESFFEELFKINWFEVGVKIGEALWNGIKSTFKKLGEWLGITSGNDSVDDMSLEDYSNFDLSSNDYEITENSTQKIDVSLSVTGDGTAVGESNANVVGSALADTIDEMLGRKLNG